MAKKPFLCKYECNTLLGPDFDTKENRYLEFMTGELHDRDRCQAIKDGSIVIPQPTTKPTPVSIATPATAPNPIQKVITDSTPKPQLRSNTSFTDTKAEDIKRAQAERLRQHNQLMRAMTNLYKIIELDVGVRSGKTFQEIRDLIDFRNEAGNNLNDTDPHPDNLDYEQ